MTALQQLQHNVEQSFRWSAPQPANWVPPTPGVDHDVVILGGGQTGVAIAYGLRRQGVNNTLVIDQAQPGEAGIWTNIARMNLLRTSKFLAGPEFGNPALSFRAWFETQFGAQAFDALQRIRREDWAAYLAWYQKTVKVEVQYETRLLRIEPVAHAATNGLLRLHLQQQGEPRTVVTRKLVLATGFGGAGENHIPALFHSLPKHLWAHTSEAIDFAALKGKRLAIVGAGPSAFDAAGVALEQGAGAVHLFSRRAAITHQPNSPKGETSPQPPDAVPAPPKAPPGRNYPGAFTHFHKLPDAVRWQYHFKGKGAPASTPEDSIQRATAFDNFHIHLNAPWNSASADASAVRVVIDGEAFAFDYVIAGTGFRVDLSARPELQGVAEHIALWGDRYTPPPGEEYPQAALFPYLGEGFEFLEKQPGATPWVRHIYGYNWAAALSSGKNLSDVPSMPELDRIIGGITRSLFLEDLPHHAERIAGPGPAKAASDPHAVYAQAIWPKRRAAATSTSHIVQGTV
ncbi:NAD(P)/FAD-dependent oxidoreductase [Corticibacter populi]|uniref:NAD(P)/FAD-dependent oxidoreductase n=1 Tax=Corticibacter populi TaxID=1550736 RepID=A0A3M6QTH4_9BURK|nr:SidA/IucD/PvdA family monooxygenase [Corticibacter populi]RMX05859.1 NAD(P)/FAD-dependent oxidoreductase [Corticibacter populi]RZS30823.1 cation diffusion facilitator CzcD-associated flavoprotein CzcO [Corticibacter populi]